MNKSDLIDAIAKRPEIEDAKITKKSVGLTVDAFVAVVTESLVAGEKVQLAGFGTLVAKERAARIGRNPRTGETIQIAPSRSPAFTAGKALKEAVKIKEEPKKKGRKKAAAKK